MSIRIVVGISSFKLKSLYLKSYTYDGKNYKSVEVLGKTYETVEIEIRQKYFHVLWIPVCPIKKEYILKHGDERLYLLRSVVGEEIKKETPKAPWYSFSACILGLLILFGIYVNGSYRQHQKQKKIEKLNQSKVKRIENIKLNDIYIMDFKNTNPEKKRKDNYHQFMSEKRFCVSKVGPDSILFQELFYNKKSRKYQDYSEYFNKTDSANFFRWHKADLIKSCEDFVTLPYTNNKGLLKVSLIYDAEKRKEMDHLKESAKRNPQYEQFMQLQNKTQK